MQPVLKYRGGKRKEIKHFNKFIPDKIETYIEPFVGGGAVFFHLEHDNNIINDVNNKLMEFYRDLKYNYETMREQLDKLQKLYEKNRREYERKKGQSSGNKRVKDKNENLYYQLRDEYNYPSGKWLKGVLYYFINKTAYSGMIRYNQQGEFNVPYGRYKNFNTNLIKPAHHNLLQDTEIYNKDFSEIFAMATPDDFIFLDPPYDTTFNDYGNENGNYEFDESEHRRLSEDFKNLSCKALMVIGETQLTRELYRKYITGKYDKNYTVNIKNRFNSKSTHLIITNYNPKNN
ncbi:MAG: DNA adenine methylase [Halanaerobiales bacterium]